MRRVVFLVALATTACATTHERGEAELHVVAGDDARAWRWSVTDEAGKHRCDLPCEVVVHGPQQLDVSGRGEAGGALAIVQTDLPSGTYTVTLGAPKRRIALPLVLAGIGVALVVAGAALELPECVGPDAGSLGYAVPSDCSRKDAGTMLLTSSLLMLASAAFVLLVDRPFAPVTISREPTVYH
jgi:hypothetical protein